MNRKLIFRYALFAVIATLTNLLSQELMTHLYTGPYSIKLSIIVGTGTGLVCKYILDKRYIFSYQTSSLKHEGKTFFLYNLMGLITTVIFWATEWSFWLVFATKEMRYIGATLGLAVGYFVKFNLDKRFVFSKHISATNQTKNNS